MPQLEGLKEQLTYLRLWLGIIAVAEVSLFGWTAASLDDASPRLLSLAIIVIMALGLGILLLHRMIERRTEQIRRL